MAVTQVDRLNGVNAATPDLSSRMASFCLPVGAAARQRSLELLSGRPPSTLERSLSLPTGHGAEMQAVLAHEGNGFAFGLDFKDLI